MLIQIQKILRQAKQTKRALFWNCRYATLREPKIKSWVPHADPKIQRGIIKELERNGFKLTELEINVSDYKKYMKKAEYNQSPDYFAWKTNKLVEKTLEHYLAAKLLDLSKNDIYIDIASADSPTPKIYRKLYDCQAYQQDLVFPKGIHGNVIGGDAASMPVKDEFATKMALHCSFEHFEQDSDIEFIKEAGRILKKRGKLCIIPLYLFNRYAIQTDPPVLPKRGMVFESDATLYCAKGYENRHGRFYDIPHFIDRIRNNQGDLKLTIYVVQNEKDVDLSCYVKFIALFEKK